MVKGCWTEERENEFRRMYADGASHTQLAGHFGVTRNASIGKAHRLGLEGRHKTGEGRKPRAKRNAPFRVNTVVAYKTAMEKKRQDAIARAKAGARDYAEIAKGDTSTSPNIACFECMDFETMCSWPLRDDPVQYCGRPKSRRVSYCEFHRRGGTQTPKRRWE